MKLLLSIAFLFATASLQAQVPLIDYSFLAVPPAGFVNKVIVQPDGKILLAGAFTNYAAPKQAYTP